MLRIVEVIPTLSMGGAESMVRDYCLLIDKKRFDVSVIVLTEHKGTPVETALEDAGIKVIYLGELLFESRNIGLFKRAIRRVSRYYYFRKTIGDIEPDVIHLHLQIGRYMRVLPLKSMKSKLLLTVHNVPERFFCRDKSDRKKYDEYREVYRLIHEYGMQLITLHDGLNEQLRNLFDTDKVMTLHNGIRVDRFETSEYDRNEVRYRLGIRSNEVVIGHVGSMHPQKNHDLILKVFEEYNRSNTASRLLLVGDGELKADIIHRIEERRLTDKVILLSNRDDVPALMSAMDVFLFPSRWEGFGNVLIEAQSMKLPCVISDVIPQDVRVTEKIHVVSLDSSVTEWIAAINSALNGISGLDPVNTIDDYDMTNSVRHLEKIYSERMAV